MPNSKLAPAKSTGCRPPTAGNCRRSNKLDPPAAALATHQPLVPVGDGHLGTVALGHLSRGGLDLVLAIETPDDQPYARR